MIEVAALAATPEGSPPAAAITATGSFVSFHRHHRQLIVLAARPPVLDPYVLTFDVADFEQSAPERGYKMGGSGDLLLRNPMTGIAGCCARAASGHATAPPPRSKPSTLRPGGEWQSGPMSAVTPIADNRGCGRIVRIVPIADAANCLLRSPHRRWRVPLTGSQALALWQFCD
jgi:hypothetical protein